MDTSKLFRVDGMVAVITGGGSGIGLMMALALAGAGAKKVYILGRREDVLKSAAAQHPSLRPLVCDVGSKESLQSAVDTVTKEIGYVNLVIANSGVSGPLSFYNSELSIQELRKSMYEDVSMVEFTDTFRVNATGAYFTLLAFLELLDAGNQNAARGGFGAPLEENSDVLSIQSQVIFTSSAAGVSRLDPLAPAYMASKAAIDHLAKGASTNLSQHGIRVNVLAPGFFPSDMADPLIAHRNFAQETPKDPNYIPARRIGTEEEMAGSVLYLASRAGAFCNGLTLLIDGGRLSVIPSTY